MIEIRRYSKYKESQFFQFLEKEGEEWSCYYAPKNRDRYALNLEKSISYLLYKDKEIIGYIRALEDFGFYIYICDLLVDKDHRGHGYGNKMMEHIKSIYPNHDIYVMSDIDPYYEKQGYKKEGSVFLLPRK